MFNSVTPLGHMCSGGNRIRTDIHGVKAHYTKTFVRYRYIFCGLDGIRTRFSLPHNLGALPSTKLLTRTPGGIRTHTEMILSHLPSSSWATGAFNILIQVIRTP